MSTPFDLDTIKRVGTSKYDRVDADSETISHIRINDDGKNYVLHERDNSASSDNQKLRIYDIQGNYSVTFPSGTTTKPSGFGDGLDPTTTTYLRLVSLDGSNILITDHREIA